MRRNTSVEDKQINELSNFYNFNMQSPSSNRLRTMLRRRDSDLQREKQRYRGLEGNFRIAQDDLKQLKINNAHLRAELFNVDEKVFSVIENHMQSYARQRGFGFETMTGRSVPRLLDQLLHNTMKNKDLREETRSLRLDAQTLRSKLQLAENAEVDRQIAQDQAKALQEQVHTLQQQLLARVDKECAISDDKFTKEFRCLVASIKSLSRSIHIKKDMNMLAVLGVGCLLIDVNSDHWNTRARKKCLAEAWVWSVLIDRVFTSPFATLEERGGSMADLWYRLFGGDHQHGWPTPSALCEKWRYITMERSVEAFGLDTSMNDGVEDARMVHDDKLDSLFQDDETVCSRVRANAINIISTRLAAVSPKGDFVQIPGIVDRAISLAAEMSLQHCRLQVTYPAVNASFVESQMSTITDPDGEYTQDGVVAFVVNPGLTKWGDAKGKDLDQRYDIVPALVQLEPAMVKREYI